MFNKYEFSLIKLNALNCFEVNNPERPYGRFFYKNQKKGFII